MSALPRLTTVRADIAVGPLRAEAVAISPAMRSIGGPGALYLDKRERPKAHAIIRWLGNPPKWGGL